MSELRALHCLVTGGAGYIGSHVARELHERGARVTVVDNLYSGHRWAVGDADLVEADVGAAQVVESLLASRRFDALLHFAAHIWVGESVANPGKYYRNNTANAAILFDLAARYGIGHVVFSSTAAVYGACDRPLIDETTPLAPIAPYGTSKMMAERVLTDIAAAAGQGVAILRYFNVAGARDDGSLGEATPDNSHLVKVACEAALGLRAPLKINGDDYTTPDGTCVRDYIHVQDLAVAHVAALQRHRRRGDGRRAGAQARRASNAEPRVDASGDRGHGRARPNQVRCAAGARCPASPIRSPPST
ncbi:MAG: UDP-glucose 4-epimerase GalE [Alphaproteobacteria bacterium]